MVSPDSLSITRKAPANRKATRGTDNIARFNRFEIIGGRTFEYRSV